MITGRPAERGRRWGGPGGEPGGPGPGGAAGGLWALGGLDYVPGWLTAPLAVTFTGTIDLPLLE